MICDRPTEEPRYKPGDTVSLVDGRDVHIGRVRGAAKPAPDADAWLYPLQLVDGRCIPAYEYELRRGGAG